MLARRPDLRRRFVARDPRAHPGTARESTRRRCPSTASPTSRSTPGSTTNPGAPDVERWFFSVVPSAMIFDDHDMIDDWNISASWVRDIRNEPWWRAHVVGGLVSYWIYQHLGNLQPGRDPRRGHARSDLERRRRRAVPARLGGEVGGVHARARRLPIQLSSAISAACAWSSSTVAMAGCSSRVAGPCSTPTSGAWVARALSRRCRPPLDRDVAAGVRHRRAARSAGLERGGVRRGVGPPGRVDRRAAAARPRSRGLAGVHTLVRRVGGAARRSWQRPQRSCPLDHQHSLWRHPFQLYRGGALSRTLRSDEPCHTNSSAHRYATRSCRVSVVRFALRCHGRANGWSRAAARYAPPTHRTDLDR